MKPDGKKRGGLAGLLKRVPGGALIFAVLPLAILSYLGWYYYGAEHLDHALYSLRVENIELTQQPDWVPEDLVKEVYLGRGLERISLLGPQACPLIAQAFEAHHWIKATPRVSKSYGGKVQVEVVYRKPLAMVVVLRETKQPPEVEAIESIEIPELGFLPLDTSGVLLPNFELNNAYEYFVIIAPGAKLSGELGKPSGDPGVAAALTLCELLEPIRSGLSLRRVYVSRNFNSTSLQPWLLALSTGDGRRIVWGHPPGYEAGGEPPAADKIQRMRNWLASTDTSAKSLDLTQQNSQASAVGPEYNPSQPAVLSAGGESASNAAR